MLKITRNQVFFIIKCILLCVGVATKQCRHTRERSDAGMAKLVDALDLGSSGAPHRSSSLLTRTKISIRAPCGAFFYADNWGLMHIVYGPPAV